MEIQIEPIALVYIKNKSKDLIVTLDVVERPGGECSCCGSNTPCVPSAKIGKPKNLENYEVTLFEGVTIYYRPSVARMFSKVTIKIEKLFFVKCLVATGDIQR